jgi:hypothetical protein
MGDRIGEVVEANSSTRRKRMKFFASLLIVLFIPQLPLAPAWAQEDPPPVEEQTISGTVVNLTSGQMAPAGLEVMLHGWGSQGEQLEMLHGELEQGGTFKFEGVLMEPEAVYAAMVVYLDVTYFSSPRQLIEEGGLSPIEISVYETTTSDDLVTIDQHHIFLDFGQGGLSVAEIYSLTNDGDRAIKDAVILEGDRSATLEFPLPVGAANLFFLAAPADRFVSQAEGFADTRPLIPGEQSGQIAATYVLQYEDGLTFQHSIPYDTQEISVFLPYDSELSLENDTAEYLGAQTFADGKTYETYLLGNASAGEEIELELPGRPAAQTSGMSRESQTEAGSEEGIAVGLGVLGATLIAAGIWWWRREDAEVDAPEDGLEFDEANAL